MSPLSDTTDESFLVTGGFFDDTSEGYLGKLTLFRSGSRMSMAFTPLLITEPPAPGLRLKNKGFAGGSIGGALLWVCSANQVLGYSLEDLRLERIIDDPHFNDLHYVLAESSGLVVVNTGLESLDRFGYDGVFRGRTLLTSDERTNDRILKFKNFRIANTKPHFMHPSFCYRRGDGHLLVTFVRQRRIVDLEDWTWASPEFSASPHDGHEALFAPTGRACVWATTVSGEVLAFDPKSKVEVARWILAEHGLLPGWTRGLCVLQHGFLVGITRIRAADADYHPLWNKELAAASRTTIAYVPFDKTRQPLSVEVLNERSAKIFSILSLRRNKQ